MPADLRDAQPSSTATDAPAADLGRRHARRGWLLMVFAAWNVWLWVTRTINLIEDPTPRSTGFITVHALLYGGSLLFALAIGTVGWRMRREARAHRDLPA